MGEATSQRRAATFLTGALMPYEFEELHEIQRGGVSLGAHHERMMKRGYIEWDDSQQAMVITDAGIMAMDLHRKYQRVTESVDGF
jgi:hypothetical protein